METNELNLIKLCINKLKENNNYVNNTWDVIDLLETLKEAKK